MSQESNSEPKPGPRLPLWSKVALGLALAYLCLAGGWYLRSVQNSTSTNESEVVIVINPDLTAVSLCVAADLVDQGETSGAYTYFYNRSHNDLHVLAGQMSESERQRSSQMLQQKLIVEQLLEDQSPEAAVKLRQLAAIVFDSSGEYMCD
jgi:hypothetical protein